METRLTSRELGKTGVCPVTTSCPCVSALSPGYPSSPPHSAQGHSNPPTCEALRIRLSLSTLIHFRKLSKTQLNNLAPS